MNHVNTSKGISDILEADASEQHSPIPGTQSAEEAELLIYLVLAQLVR